ncbi:MAG: hypothetical protein ACJ741_10510 [Pyrinomonadaceae bacterium]
MAQHSSGGHEDANKGSARERVAYARRLFDRIAKWYAVSDAKAEKLIGFDGVFTAFLVTLIFGKRDDVNGILGGFRLETYWLLALMCLFLAISILSALACFWSNIEVFALLRRRFARQREEALTRKGGQRTNEEGEAGRKPSDIYEPEEIWFFQKVGWLEEDKFKRTLLRVNSEAEVQALASQCIILARRVTWKHLWLNIGILCAALSLLCFLGIVFSYLVRNFIQLHS